jgi:hypothetical protein
MSVKTYRGSCHCGAIRFEADIDLDEGSNRCNCSYCVCGIRTYARGNLDSLGGTFHAVSVPALDLSPEQFATIPVRYVNGRDRRYDETPAHPEAI